MKHLAPAAALVVILALLTGCTPSAPAATPSPQQARAIWRAPANLVGEPQVVGDTIVSYLRVKQKLLVAAWDLDTGGMLWNTAAETSGEAPGIELGVDAITVGKASYVAYLKKLPGSSWRELVVADARTGARQGTERLIVWPSSRPRACSDDQAFCLQGSREAAPDTQVNLRINPLAPALATDRGDAVPANSRAIGENIFATDDRAPDGVEKLGRMVNNKTIWQRPYADVFGKGASSDHGWDWRDFHNGVIVGIGSPSQCTTTGKSGKRIMTCDFAQSRMVGLNADTGATVWSIDGVDTCATGPHLGMAADDRIIGCRNKVAKNVRVPDGEYWVLKSRISRVDLIAVRPQTGEILWQADLGTETGVGSALDFVSSDERIVLTRNRKTSSYDLATGAATPTDATSRLFCRRERPSLMLHWLGEKDGTEYNIGEDVEPCDGNGKAIKEIPAEWVPAAGIDAGDGRWLLPTPGAMTLVQLS